MRIARLAAWYGILFLWTPPAPLLAREAQDPWQKQWDSAVEAGNRDAQLVVYHTRGPFDKVFAEFNKRFPGIKIVSAVGRGGELISRIMAERRAGKHAVDLYMGSTGTPLDVLYPAKVLEPFAPLLILPEVKDPSLWFAGKHHYGDPENRYIFVFEGVVRSDLAFHTGLVNPREFASYWDLVQPRWKGKIAAMDPKLAGFPVGLLQFAHYHPGLGAGFLRRLFGEMDITLSRDSRQLVDWLAVGKFAIAVAASANDVRSAIKSGLPVSRFEPRAFKEGIYMRATQGSISVLSRFPHPAATRVFINWLLSREGQALYQKYFSGLDPVFSLRSDVPVDPAVEPYRPGPGETFMSVYGAEFRDLQGAHKVIDEALKR